MNKASTRKQARLQAERRFGNITHLREQSRDFRLSSTLDTTLQDLRYAVRGMRKSPAFALTAILSLASRSVQTLRFIPSSTPLLLRSLPVPEPDRLFTLATPYIREPGKERPAEDVAFSYPLLQEFRAAAGDSARLALFTNPNTTDVQIPNKDAPIEKAICQFVSGDAFDMLGVPPVLGRVFSTADDRVAEPNLVISYDYWQRRFQGDPRVLGQHIQIGPQSFTIVGVARRGFFGVEPGKFTDVWRPATMANKGALANRSSGWFRIFGRLSPVVSRSQILAPSASLQGGSGGDDQGLSPDARRDPESISRTAAADSPRHRRRIFREHSNVRSGLSWPSRQEFS